MTQSGAGGSIYSLSRITRVLRVHGHTAIVARQSGDQLPLQAELPGFGRQMHA